MRAEDNIEVIFFPQDTCALETMKSRPSFIVQKIWLGQCGDYLLQENKMLREVKVRKELGRLDQ